MSKDPAARKAGNLSANYKCLKSSTMVKFQNKQEFMGPCHKTFYGCNQYPHHNKLECLSLSVTFTQKGPKRRKKAQKGPKRPKKAQKGPKRLKKAQKGSKRPKKAISPIGSKQGWKCDKHCNLSQQENNYNCKMFLQSSSCEKKHQTEDKYKQDQQIKDWPAEREREGREKMHETAVRVNISVSALASKYILI